ncbi:hypothetical protein MMC06_003164, partial [Schaereria dolodes]|nr:hypothetical protein [Schaereria dolodes]
PKTVFSALIARLSKIRMLASSSKGALGRIVITWSRATQVEYVYGAALLYRVHEPREESRRLYEARHLWDRAQEKACDASASESSGDEKTGSDILDAMIKQPEQISPLE